MWEKIAEMMFVGKFDLCITRSDIHREKWTQNEHREVGVKYFKLCHAKEELQRLNIEVWRLQAFIYKEEKHTGDVIKQLSAQEPFLANELRQQWALCSSINLLHIQQFKKLQRELFYTGSQDLGEDIMEGVIPIGNIISHSLEREDQTQVEIEQDTEFGVITEFVANLVD